MKKAKEPVVESNMLRLFNQQVTTTSTKLLVLKLCYQHHHLLLHHYTTNNWTPCNAIIFKQWTFLLPVLFGGGGGSGSSCGSGSDADDSGVTTYYRYILSLPGFLTCQEERAENVKCMKSCRYCFLFPFILLLRTRNIVKTRKKRESQAWRNVRFFLSPLSLVFRHIFLKIFYSPVFRMNYYMFAAQSFFGVFDLKLRLFTNSTQA